MIVRRWMLMPILLICAVGWAGLMGATLEPSRTTPASDGSTAAITYFDYDQSSFSDVTVYVSVLDSDGQTVSGLPENAFTITEDNVAVDVIDFIMGGEQPVTAVLLIDRSGSMNEGTKLEDAIAAALAFLDHLHDGRDRLGAIAFHNQVSTLGTLRLMDSSVRADLQEQISQLTSKGGTAYYDAIHQAVTMLRGAPGRKVVLALTDGRDEHSDQTAPIVVDYATEQNVVLYTIGLGTIVNREVLSQMAQDTNGEYHEEPSSTELADLYTSLAQSLQDEYSLTYTSPTPRLDGTTRQVAAKVQLPAGTVTATGRYAVGGTLTPSLNLWPCLGAFPLLLMLTLPGLYDRLRGRGTLVEPEPALPSELAPPPTFTPSVSPRTGTALMGTPSTVDAPSTASALTPSVTCPGCGRTLRTGARFCPECGRPTSHGAPIPAEEKATDTDPKAVCAHCSAPIRTGAKFCRSCGRPVQSMSATAAYPSCPQCGAPLPPGAPFCANCGQRV
jgi:VWFA-related protein